MGNEHGTPLTPRTGMTGPQSPPQSLGAGGSPNAAGTTGAALPGRRLVKLELENVVLRKKAGIQEERSVPATKTQQHLQAVDQENLDLQHQIENIQAKVDRTKAALENRQAPRPPVSNQDLGRSLTTFNKELELSQKRSIEIRRNHEERARALTLQLNQFKSENNALMKQNPAAPNVGVADSHLQQRLIESHQRIEEVTAARSALLQQLRDMTASTSTVQVDGVSDNAEVKQLKEDIERCRANLEDLKKEMALKNAAEFGSHKCKQLSGEVGRLRDELELKRQELNDERVRTESEVQELKIEAGRAKDLLEAERTELQFVLEMAKALREVNVSPGGPNQPSAENLMRLREETAEQRRELDLLKKTEDARTQTIRDLNKELEELEEQACRTCLSFSAPSPESPPNVADMAEQRRKLEEEIALLKVQEERSEKLQRALS